jgi:hypothetical protein
MNSWCYVIIVSRLIGTLGVESWVEEDVDIWGGGATFDWEIFVTELTRRRFAPPRSRRAEGFFVLLQGINLFIIWHWVTIQMLTILLWPLYCYKVDGLVILIQECWPVKIFLSPSGAEPSKNFVKIDFKERIWRWKISQFKVVEHLSYKLYCPRPAVFFRKFYEKFIKFYDNPPQRTIWQWIVIFITLLFFIFVLHVNAYNIALHYHTITVFLDLFWEGGSPRNFFNIP